MKSRLLVDTDILIDTARNIHIAVERLKIEEKQSKLFISSITYMELVVGCRDKKELTILNKFLERFEVLHVNEIISEKAIELLKRYRLSHGLLIPDTIIVATSLNLNIPFLSKNQKDYKYIEGIELCIYP